MKKLSHRKEPSGRGRRWSWYLHLMMYMNRVLAQLEICFENRMWPVQLRLTMPAHDHACLFFARAPNVRTNEKDSLNRMKKSNFQLAKSLLVGVIEIRH